eukprot:TRINITY_DN6472_c0_g1_i1.p1 TRINITY_DN6472_c0_g1~~TRINITY_DN6472_c0_g1_i1.p1  ORF type:complete len:351 (+),score=80.75 TRINITY_DN6472_c0_g1_i1:2-1054(+)
MVGMLTGGVAGLVAVTPCAGYIRPWASFVIGIVASALSYTAIIVKTRIGWDDALDVWACHGVGGFVGSIMLGIFAQKKVDGVSGLIEGDGYQFGIQIAAAVIVSAWSVLVTVVLLLLLNLVVRVRVSEIAERAGLDVLDTADHGAYDFDRPDGALAQAVEDEDKVRKKRVERLRRRKIRLGRWRKKHGDEQNVEEEPRPADGSGSETAVATAAGDGATTTAAAAGGGDAGDVYVDMDTAAPAAAADTASGARAPGGLPTMEEMMGLVAAAMQANREPGDTEAIASLLLAMQGATRQAQAGLDALHPQQPSVTVVPPVPASALPQEEPPSMQLLVAEDGSVIDITPGAEEV